MIIKLISWLLIGSSPKWGMFKIWLLFSLSPKWGGIFKAAATDIQKKKFGLIWQVVFKLG